MSDLPEELRDHRHYVGCGCHQIREDAADALDAKDAEIERLQAQVNNQACDIAYLTGWKEQTEKELQKGWPR